MKCGLARLRLQLNSDLSLDTLKRFLKAENYVWKRARRSSRHQRSEADFREAQETLQEMRTYCQSAQAEFDLAYFDGAGFTLEPSVPSAWQLRGTTLEIPSRHSRRLNVLGFLNLNDTFFSLVIEGSVEATVLIAAFDAYCVQLQKPVLLVLDNAPVHHSVKFQAARQRWEEQGLYLLFLPPYSPELNLIEIVWRKIKYEWLPLSAYESFKELTSSLFEVLGQVGSKYRISFA